MTTAPPGTQVHVRVPATSANLGPGFDAAGLALALHDDVRVLLTSGGLVVDVHGEGADRVPRNERNLLVSSLRAAFDRLGGQPAGLDVRCRNSVPQSRGLGSSAAAIVAAVVAARALTPDGDALLDDTAALQLANEIEGHPDNVAACLLGGATFAWQQDGVAGAYRLDAHPDLAPVVLVPAERSSTKAVRGLLPTTVPYEDAVFNASRAALLPYALTRDLSLLALATQDRLHQDYRAPAMPRTHRLVTELRGRGLAAVVSGAGPSVLVLCDSAGRAAVLAGDRPGWTVLPLAVEARGAHVAGPAAAHPGGQSRPA